MKTKCPYDDCSKSLSSRFNLQRHIDTCHLHIKRFECEVCFKRFASKQNLHEHQFIHTSPESPLCPDTQTRTELTRDIEIPKLSELVYYSNDVMFRPFLHVNRIYPFPVVYKEELLPRIGKPQRNAGLPKFNRVDQD